MPEQKFGPKGPESQENNSEVIEILQALGEGGRIWYLYLSGGVGLHRKGMKTPEPINMQTFLDLREKGFIDVVESRETGYPIYADNEKSQIYSITEKGKKYLE